MKTSKVTSKEEFELLLEIRELKRKIGIADHPNNVEDLPAERDRLRRMVNICYGKDV